MPKIEREDDFNPYDFMVDLYAGDPKAAEIMETYLQVVHLKTHLTDIASQREFAKCKRFISNGYVAVNEATGEVDFQKTLRAIEVSELDVSLEELIEKGIKTGEIIVIRESDDSQDLRFFNLDGLIQAAFWKEDGKTPNSGLVRTQVGILNTIDAMHPELKGEARQVIKNRISYAIELEYLAESSEHKHLRKMGWIPEDQVAVYKFNRHKMPHRLDPFNVGF